MSEGERYWTFYKNCPIVESEKGLGIGKCNSRCLCFKHDKGDLAGVMLSKDVIDIATCTHFNRICAIKYQEELNGKPEAPSPAITGRGLRQDNNTHKESVLRGRGRVSRVGTPSPRLK